MEGPMSLTLLSEKILHHAVNPRLIAYCPSMDLLALVSTDQQVLVYRFNGQRVFGVTQKSGKLRVEDVRWKPNGQLLAISWSDGTVRLVSAESSKTVHQFAACDQDSAGITCMGWASNNTGRESNSGPAGKSKAWTDILTTDDSLFGEKKPLDLPQDLAHIDIESSLPKLSVLAAGGTSEDVFSSRASLDALFRPLDPSENNTVDVMMIGTKEGSIHLTIYDSFVVGSFNCPISIDGIPSPSLAMHVALQPYSTHNLIMQSQEDGNLYFIPMDLRFISASSDYLALLASRSTALQNLLRYIHQVQALMFSEFKTTQELPGRFLSNINETLAEDRDRNIVQALYHSVATGHTFPAVREWLVDELAERGHKRWEKAVVTGLEGLRKLVHENMLPALERCSVILSRLSGIAKFQSTDDSIGYTSKQISQIMDIVACLHLVASKILIQVVDELELFGTFSAWLRYEIDRLASEASSSANDDQADKEASIDHGKVLLYLETVMTRNPLGVFLDDTTDEDKKDWAKIGGNEPVFGLLVKELRKQESGHPYLKALPRVEILCNLLSQHASSVFSQIADGEKRNVLFGQAVKLGTAYTGRLTDMRMQAISPTSFFNYIVFVPRDEESIVHVVRIELYIEKGVSMHRAIIASSLRVGDGVIKDVKILDDETMLLLWESEGLISLLDIPYKSPEPAKGPTGDSDRSQRSHVSFLPTIQYPEPTIISNEELLKAARFKLSLEDAFVPTTMEIRAAQDRRSGQGSRRLVLLSQDRLRYKIFRIPDVDHEGVVNNDVAMRE
ncbi:Anaphase-promoting complex subunit 4 [Phlyctema vagabunda]|uniref:Anaphase-promoting complex subunit 4 n=1 Tax=Phlyctema vagabunda TaxID=108571 RepID=A0ABR4P7S5_9HELO